MRYRVRFHVRIGERRAHETGLWRYRDVSMTVGRESGRFIPAKAAKKQKAGRLFRGPALSSFPCGRSVRVRDAFAIDLRHLGRKRGFRHLRRRGGAHLLEGGELLAF